MSICERCGMNAVDARGLCHNCGWQAGATQEYGAYLNDDDSPSLGKTRVAEAPVAPGGQPTAGTRVMTPTPPQQPTQTARVTGRPGDAPAYCGTCGARLEDGQAFCGQCGSPVPGVDDLASRVGAGLTVAAPPIGPAPGSGPARYRIGDPQGWADDDARTEMYTAEAVQRPPYGPYGSGGGTRGRVPTPPYGARGYTSGYAVPAEADNSARTLKIVFGLLCLAAGLITALAAIILALHTF